MAREPVIFLTAGEASGDAIGARLMAALSARTGGAVRFAGVGGPLMRAQGLESLFPMDELAVMGFLEVLPHVRGLRRRIAETAAAVDRLAPDALVTIDAPGFSKRVVDRLTRRLPKIHYVAPQVWAWKPGRVHAFRARFDRVLCLLPFEPPYFERVGLDARFVGHPVLEAGADRGDGPAFRARQGIAADAPVLAVLPGSRRGEVGRLLPVFGRTVARLAETHPGLTAVLPTLPGLAGAVETAVADWPVPTRVLPEAGEKYDAMAAADAALAASGTVALELALARVPTVIAYRLNPVSFWAINRMSPLEHVHLCNILAGRELVPERLQGACRPERLAADLDGLLAGEGAAQIAGLEACLALLRPEDGGAPSAAAADAVLELI